LNSKSITSVYFLLLIIELIGEYLTSTTTNALLVFLSKPLLMISLMFLAFHSNQQIKIPHFKLLFFALLFSMFGDIALMFLPYYQDIFIVGLGCFLIAHLFYILLFTKPAKANNSYNIFFVILPVLFGITLIYFLYQQDTVDFNKLQVPVIIYACVILLMLITALNRFKKVSDSSFKWVTIGAFLFVLSDTTIALNKFSDVFVNNEMIARLTIMSLYGIAQYMIVKGLITEKS
jgi:uncharacterized membrane protein YhhN